MTHKFRRTLGILVCLMGIAAVGEVQAACNARVRDVTSTAWTGAQGRGYDVYDSQRRTQVVTFGVSGQGDACSFYATVSPAAPLPDGGGYLTSAAGMLLFGLARDASGNQRIKPEGIAGESDAFIGAVAGPGSTDFQFHLVLAPEQVVPPGVYTGEIEFSLYEGTFGKGVLRDRRRVVVSAQVSAIAEVAFAQGAGFDPNHQTHSMSFGNLRKGDRRSVTVKGRANGGYRLRLQSANGGALRHVDPTDDSRVPYTLRVDGSVVPLAGGAETQVLVHSDATSRDGRSHSLEIQIEELGDASAGDYRDTVTIVVQSLR